jgi:hypothetical protein
MKIGTAGINFNMNGFNLLDSFGIKLPKKLFYLVISANKAVVWHS